MNVILNCLGKIAEKWDNVLIKYRTTKAIESFAEFGKNSHIAYPFLIRGTNEFTPGVKYIHIGDGVSLGTGVTLFATRAHVYIGKHTISGPHLTIMNGNHPADVIGKFIADNRKVDLEKQGVDISKYDQDVVIDEDVWLGSNVTILKGVHIGRGAIVAAGSVVTRSLPAYSISGGIPAKVLKFRWSIEEIMEHEVLLYPENQRFSKEQLEINRKQFESK